MPTFPRSLHILPGVYLEWLMFFKQPTFFHQQVLFSSALLTTQGLIARVGFCYKMETIYMILKYQFWKQAGEISNRNHLLMSLLLDFSLYVLFSSPVTIFSLTPIIFMLWFLELHHSLCGKRGSQAWQETMDKKQDRVESETTTENSQELPLAPSPHHSEHPRQHRPGPTSILQASLLSIWQLTNIKEDGRNYLNSPG